MKPLYLLLLAFICTGYATYAVDNGGDSSGSTTDEQIVLDELIADAQSGDVGAKLLLGHMYANGQGAPKDLLEAVKWYTQAAEQGDADAQFMLGTLYAEGRGIKQDYKEAVRWYTLAANQGNVEVQIILGLMFAEGQGVETDLNTAIHWLNKAASKGNVQAQQYLQQIFATMRQDASQKPSAQPVPAAEPNEITLTQYAFKVDGFSVLFPFEPQKTVVQDNSRIRAIQYKSASRDGLVQYNVSLQQFKGEMMEDDEIRKAFLTDYIAGRAMFAWKNRIQKQQLLFKNSRAVQFKHATYSGRIEMVHEGIKFFSGNDSITLTCVYPRGGMIPISFEQFKASFGFISDQKINNKPTKSAK